jgi:hypothetical protein
VATNTTKLGLEKPASSDFVNIAVLNQNFDDIDAAVGAKIVTSITRPVSPYSGMFIYETDTDKILVYDGATSSWEGVKTSFAETATTADNALKVGGRTIYVQSATPTGMATGDLWFWGS